MASAASTLFVQNLYSTILLRTGSAADVNSWATLLDSTLLTQSQELSAFETSPEAVAFVDPAVRMYQTFFGRSPDPSGLNGWVNALRSGTISQLGLAEGFSHSQEFLNRYGTNPNFSAFVTALYQNVLGRAPDTAGLAGWVAALANGALDFAGVALGFSNSPEFINNSTGPINTWLTAADAAANAGGVVSPPGSPVYPNQGQAIPGIVGSGPSTQFVLTTGLDNATATSFLASETTFNIDGHGPTLNPGDTLTGAGSNNTLTIVDLTPGGAGGGDNVPAGVVLNNIQNVILNTSNNTAASGFSTVGFPGVKNLTVTTAGVATDFVAAASGTNGTVITVNHAAVTAGGVIAIGGTDVTVTANGLGGTVLVGSTAFGTVPAAANLATGNITVTENDTAGGELGVVGGASVTVNVSSASSTSDIDIGNTGRNTGNSAAGGATNTAGAITVTDNGIGDTGYMAIFGGSTVSVTSSGGPGTITIGDAAANVASNEAKGAVTLSDLAANAYDGKTGAGHNNVVGGTLAVYGGTNISVTSNTGGSIFVGGGATATGALPTGTVTVVNTGLTLDPNSVVNSGAPNVASSVTEAGGTNISITNAGGAVTVGGAIGKINPNPTGTVAITETVATTYSTLGNLNTDVTVAGAPNNIPGRTISENGGTSVTVTALGQNTTIGANSAPTGAIAVSQSGVLTGVGAGGANGTVTISGGTTVGVTTTGGSVIVGGATGLPSGAVTIADTFSGANAANTDAFTVTGGTTVNITTTATGGAITVGPAGLFPNGLLNATGTALLAGLSSPTGNVTINNSETNSGVVTFGTGNTNVLTNGATTVSITGGTVQNIVDVESILATGGSNAGKAVGTSTLTTVTLDGPQTGAVLVQTDALATLSVLDDVAGVNVTVTDNTVGHTLALVVGNDKGLTVTDNTAKTINISDNGKVTTKGTNVLTLAGSTATTFAFANSASLTATITAGAADGALATITAAGAGALNLGDVSGLPALTAVNASGASGAVTAQINDGQTSFTGGSGNDTLTILSNTLGAKVTLDGGGGSNVLIANYAAGANDTALGSTASIKNFQTLELAGANVDSNNGAASYDATGFGGIIVGATKVAVNHGDVVLTNASAGATLSIIASPNGPVTYNLHQYTGNDTLPLSVGVDGPAGVGTGTITATVAAPKISNVTVASLGAIIPGVNANNVTIDDSVAATLKVTGDQALNLTLKTSAGGALLSSGSSLFSVDASGATGPVNLAAVPVAAIGATIVGGSGRLTVSGALGDTHQISAADEANVAQVDTVTIASDLLAGDTIALTINGVTQKVTTTGNATTDATTLSGVAFTGFALANPSAGVVTITDSTAGVLFTSSVAVTSKSGTTIVSDATTTPFLNGALSAAVDSITTGSGGGTITIGTGGSWNATPKAYDTGSETINLTASAAVSDTLVVINGATGTNNGSKGGVTGFGVTASSASADQFNFVTSAGATEPKTVISNNSTPTAVATTDAIPLTAILLGKATLANLTWTSSDGLITFGATGGHSVSEFTTGQLVAAAEIIVDEFGAGAGHKNADQIAAFISGGNTYVVASGTTGTVTTGVNDNSVVELIGVSGITGFGITAGQGTIEDSALSNAGVYNLNLVNVTANNLGTLTGSTFNDAGFSADNFSVGKSGVTNTFNNLAPSAVLNLTGAIDLGNLATTQTGTAGQNTLTLSFGAADTLDSATVSGDNTLFIVHTAANNNATITALVDPGNTITTVTDTNPATGGTANLRIDSISDTALTSLSFGHDDGVITLGGAWSGVGNNTPPVTSITQAGLSITVGNGADFISASGQGDKITTGTGASHISAIGSSDVISLAPTGGGGGNFVIANGATDTINLGISGGANAAANTITATGVGDTINEQTIGGVGSAGNNTFNLGSNAVLTLTNSGNLADTVNVVADVAGTVLSPGITMVKGATPGFVNFITTSAVANTVGVATDQWLGGGGAAAAEINVTSAASLPAAINLAAAQGAAKGGGVILGNTAIADWFQFGGNTYIVDAINNGAAPAPHAALASTDIVIELVGLVTPAGPYANHQLSV